MYVIDSIGLHYSGLLYFGKLADSSVLSLDAIARNFSVVFTSFKLALMREFSLVFLLCKRASVNERGEVRFAPRLDAPR